MNRAQYEKARAILASDCAIRHRYINAEGETCAIGALALAAGIEVETLEGWGSTGIGFVEGYAPIKEEFGLDKEELYLIQRANDALSSFDQIERRVAVLTILDSIEVQER